MDQNSQSIPILYNQSSIILPITEDDWREFVTSLLGQPETIEGYIEGAFEIDMGGLEYLDNQIDNRIGTQNDASLFQFTAKLFFNDGSSTSFNGIQRFLGYKETRPLVCDGFIFTWSYLVKFNNKQASEKQEISISSFKGNIPETKRTKRNEILSESKELAIEPRINYSIRCTDKDWGIEIIELIRRCSSRFIKVDLSFGNNFRRNIAEKIELVWFFCFLLCIILAIVFSSHWSDLNTKACNDLASQVDQYVKVDVSIDRKIDFLTQVVSRCNEKVSLSLSSFLYYFTPRIALILFTMFVVPATISKITELPNYRFLLFTEKSKKERDEYFRKLAERKTFWIATVIFGLIIGILGNYIFTILSNIGK